MQKITLNIGGMHCGSCATGIQMVTSMTDGVKSSFVDYDKKEGVIEFDETKTTKEAILKAIAELGYTAS
jgi:copper chaperone CopZ